MIPAAAAIPFMNLRLSILGNKFLLASTNGPERATRTPVIHRSRFSRPRLVHSCETAASASTGLGSANCNQKPIISSSLGSPQRMALAGSGFCGLSNELSK